MQQYTSYEESLALKDIGAPQTLRPGDYHYSSDQPDKPRLIVDGMLILEQADPKLDKFDLCCARTFTLQDMLFELIEQYDVVTKTMRAGSNSVELWEDVGDNAQHEQWPAFQFEDVDQTPFELVYAAYVWHLKRFVSSTSRS